MVGTAGAWAEISTPGMLIDVPLDVFEGPPPPEITVEYDFAISFGGYATVFERVSGVAYELVFVGEFSAAYAPPPWPEIVQWGDELAPHPDLSAALAQAFTDMGEGGSIYVMPSAMLRVEDPYVSTWQPTPIDTWRAGANFLYEFKAPPNRPPVAVASAEPMVALVGQTIKFKGDASSDPDGDPLNYYWDFDDNTSSDLPNPEHIYNAPDNYTVTLRVHDEGSLEDTAKLTVRVVTVDIKTRRKGAAEWDAGTTSIAVGGVDSGVHEAEVEIATTPPAPNAYLPLTFSAGRYSSGKDAILTLNGQAIPAGQNGEVQEVRTNAEGKLVGTLRSSDLLTSVVPCTIAFGQFKRNVDFVWHNGEEVWSSERELIEPGKTSAESVTLKLDGVGMNGHTVRFYVEGITYRDAEGNWHDLENTPDAPRDLSAYAEFPSPTAATGVNGTASAALVMKAPEGKEVVEIRMAAYDLSARKAGVVAGAPPAPPRKTSKKETAVKRKPGTGWDWFFKVVPVVTTKTKRLYVCTFRAYLNEALTDVRVKDIEFKVYVGAREAKGNEAQFTKVRKGGSTSVGEKNGFALADLSVFKPGRYEVQAFYGPAGAKLVVSRKRFVTAVGAKLGFGPKGPLTGQDKKGQEYAIAPLDYHVKKVSPTGKVDIEKVDFAATATLTPTVAGEGVKFALRPKGHTVKFVPDKGKKEEFIKVASSASDAEKEVVLDPDKEGDGALDISTEYGIYILKTKRLVRAISTKGVLGEWSETPVERKGSISPLTMICPLLKITKPTGDPEIEGEADQHNEQVFDDKWPNGGKERCKEAEGACMFRCEASPCDKLSKDAEKILWQALEWHIDDAADIVPTIYKHPLKPWSMFVEYPGMPISNIGFGLKLLKLRFKSRPDLAKLQKVELFFHGTGTSALGGGRPNYYWYWREVADNFGFGPQCDMTYDPKRPVAGDVGWFSYTLGNYQGLLRDQLITIYECLSNRTYIDFFIQTIHHENGHRQAMQLAPAKGGWGPTLAYDFTNDTNDMDGIHDRYERADLNDPWDPDVNDHDERIKWDHGLPEKKYFPATGKGLCVRNEDQVEAKAKELYKQDWSDAKVPKVAGKPTNHKDYHK